MIFNEKYVNLLTQYKQLVDANNKSVGIKVIRYSELLSRFREFIDEYEFNSRHYAIGFNIFDLFRISKYEVRNSAFLCELLDPHGTHGQGLLFLRSFILTCIEKGDQRSIFKEILLNINSGRWDVLREYSTNFGRMDIVLLNPITGSLIVIENKIEANEHKDQLSGYLEWIRTMKNEYPYSALIFLTPDGYEPFSAGRNACLCLSYKKDIFHWLDQTISQIQAPIVAAVIQQYRDIVRKQ